MYCECTNTAPLNNAAGKCSTPCLDYSSLTCGNNGGLSSPLLTVYSVYLTASNKINKYI
jgi:hypothetical protein